MTKIRLARAILAAASFNMIAATAAWADADYALHCDREFGIRANGSLPFTGKPKPAEHPLTFTVRFTGTESTRLDSLNGRTTFKNFYLESSTGTTYGGEVKDSPQRASHTYGPATGQYGPVGVRWAYSEQWKAFTLDLAGSEFLCNQKSVEQKSEHPVDPKPYDAGEANGTRWSSFILSPSKISDDGISSAATRTEYDNKPPAHAIYMIGCNRDNRFVARTDNVPDGDDAPSIIIKRTGQPPKKHMAEYRLWGAVCESKYMDGAEGQAAASNASSETNSPVQGLHGPAARAIQAQIKKARLQPAEINVFYGDLTGQGTNDAVSLVYSPFEGGNGVQLSTWVWRERDGAYTLTRTVKINELFGESPRNVKLSPGRISVTTTVQKPDDPRCCPTGVRTFTISVR